MEAIKPKRRTELQWRELIEAQPQSGMNISDYCKYHKTTTASFFSWRKKLFNTNADHIDSSTGSDNNWIPLNFCSDAGHDPEWDIELCLPGGVTLRMRKS